MKGNRTLRWLRPRVLEAPPELAADIIRLVESTPDLDLSDPVEALATAALAGLEEVAGGAGNRSEALRLLAADAALTYAFEAAAADGRSQYLATRLGLDGELGRRLEQQVCARGGPGQVEGP